MDSQDLGRNVVEVKRERTECVCGEWFIYVDYNKNNWL